MWDILVHATDFGYLKQIRKSNGIYLRQRAERDTTMRSNRSAPFVYTTYYSSDIPVKNYGNKNWSWGSWDPSVKLLIRPEILRDLPYIACEGMLYGLGCLRSTIKGIGRYEHVPDLTKLKKLITKSEIPTYMGTHEILHDHIPLEYIACILTTSHNETKIQTMFPSIPVYYIEEPEKPGPTYFADSVLPFFKVFGDHTNYAVLPPTQKSKIRLGNMTRKLCKYGTTHGLDILGDKPYGKLSQTVWKYLKKRKTAKKHRKS